MLYTYADVEPFVLLDGGSAVAHSVDEPAEQTPEELGRRDDVERRRNGAAVAEVAQPQFGTRKLPLRVRVVLRATQPRLPFFFTARRYASAVYAVVLRLSVCPSVRHTPLLH